MTMAITSCIDKFYTYRRGFVQASVWIQLDEKELESIKKYIRRMGYTFDNHICWKNRDGMCFGYSDRSLGIGLEIVEM